MLETGWFPSPPWAFTGGSIPHLVLTAGFLFPESIEDACWLTVSYLGRRHPSIPLWECCGITEPAILADHSELGTRRPAPSLDQSPGKHLPGDRG